MDGLSSTKVREAARAFMNKSAERRAPHMDDDDFAQEIYLDELKSGRRRKFKFIMIDALRKSSEWSRYGHNPVRINVEILNPGLNQDKAPYQGPILQSHEDEVLMGVGSRWLERAMECLTPRERTVIQLRYWENNTWEQIGAVLTTSYSRACQLHTLAVEKLRAALLLQSSCQYRFRSTKRFNWVARQQQFTPKTSRPPLPDQSVTP